MNTQNITLGFDLRGLFIPPSIKRGWDWKEELHLGNLRARCQTIRRIREELKIKAFPCIRCGIELKSKFGRWCKQNGFYDETGIGYGETLFATESKNSLLDGCRQRGVTHFVGSIPQDLLSLHQSLTTYHFVVDHRAHPELQQIKVVRSFEEVLEDIQEAPKKKAAEQRTIKIEGWKPEVGSQSPLQNFLNLLRRHSWVAYELYWLCKNRKHELFGKSQQILESFMLLEDGKPSEKVRQIVIEEVELRVYPRLHTPEIEEQ